MTGPPPEVLMRLGPSPQDVTRVGSARVVRGKGLVAKTGSPERIAREAFLFGEAAALMPVGLPTLVDAGPDWILMGDVGGEPVPPEDAIESAGVGTLPARKAPSRGDEACSRCSDARADPDAARG